jgi:hypothetical protein
MSITVKDALGNNQSIETPNPNGRAAASGSKPVALCNEDLAALQPSKYETIAASQTDQVLGSTGATGDFLSGLLIIPTTTSPGAVSIKDGTGSSMTVFVGGSTPSIIPFFIPIVAKSVLGAWKVTTGSNVSVFATGNFT